MERNYVLPAGSHFSAVVRGKPTGLAGCARASECARSAMCLRANAILRPVNLTPEAPVNDGCQFFISN